MGKKTKPNLMRLGYTLPWKSKWFFKKQLKYFLQEDYVIRETIKERTKNAGVAKIVIERNGDDTKVFISSNKPGLIIGRRGKGIEDIKKAILKKLKKTRKEKGMNLNFNVDLNVVELKRNEISAPVVASNIASDLERRLPFRTVIKQHMRNIKQNRSIEGAKIQVSGRLNGAEFARTEWLNFGKLPLNTLRANVDYGETTAFTTYGSIGVKVWLYKGEVFEDEDGKQK